MCWSLNGPTFNPYPVKVSRGRIKSCPRRVKEEKEKDKTGGSPVRITKQGKALFKRVLRVG